MSRPIQTRWYKVTFEYRAGHSLALAVEFVRAPTRLLALWNAREQRHGCLIRDPDCISETVRAIRRNPLEAR